MEKQRRNTEDEVEGMRKALQLTSAQDSHTEDLVKPAEENHELEETVLTLQERVNMLEAKLTTAVSSPLSPLISHAC